MRVLIACEFSGVVRSAFEARGHDAWSCDLLPSEQPGQHIQGNVLNVLGQGWDLLIAHPPCTYLANSGVRWLVRDGVLNEERGVKMRHACWIFAALYNAPIARVCIENPVMHGYATEYLQKFLDVPPYSHTFQPWQHGHGEIKRTCLWLRGLPKLVPSNIVSGRTPRVHHASPSPDRWKERSRTLSGIAAAMAEQFS